MKIKWTPEKIKEEALKYTTRSKFQDNSGSAYNAAVKKNILNEVCEHMEEVIHKPWTHEELRLEALKYTSKTEFSKNSGGAYNIALKYKIINQICAHMEKIYRNWTNSELQEIALKYTMKTHFMKENPSAYRIAHKRGIIDEICSHMPKNTVYYGEDSPNFKWNLKTLQQEALKYDNRSEFQDNSGGAYNAAVKKNILEQICSHMEILKYNRTDEELQQEALKYETRSIFQKNSPNFYSVAQRRGILDQICSHMKKSGNKSFPEIELFELIKKVFPTAKNLKDRKVKIENKPYIKGFDIDIYIPELKLGIEFDGMYHHSFKFMRKAKGKCLWSDDDIRNYHEIKDSYFLTKGINLLHIKEEDWNKDKQACINKCLEFLRITITS